MKTTILVAMALCSTAYSQTITARQVPGQKFLILGSGETKDSVVIANGVAGGQGIVGADGSFIIPINTSKLGNVSVRGLSGNLGTVVLTNASPVITSFSITKVGNAYVFSGTVNDEAPKGLTVILSGPTEINGNVIQVNSDGSFMATFNYSGASSNVVSSVTDWYSSTATRTAPIP